LVDRRLGILRQIPKLKRSEPPIPQGEREVRDPGQPLQHKLDDPIQTRRCGRGTSAAAVRNRAEGAAESRVHLPVNKD